VAANTDDEKKRMIILGTLYNRMFYNEQALQVDGISAPAPESKTFSFANEEKADWLKLLALDGTNDVDNDSNIVGMLLDKHLHPRRTHEDYEIIWSLGNDVVKELIKSRALAFLEGKQAEPFPNVNFVSEEKKKKIIEEFEQVTPLKFREMYSKLSYSERLVLFNDRGYRAKLNEAYRYIKGIDINHPAPEDKIANEDQLNEVLKPMLEKEVGAQTYAELANLIIQNSALFEGVAASPQSSKALPGRDILVTKSSMLYHPELDVAVADLLAGKREDFVVVLANARSRGASGQQPQIFILDKGVPADPKKLEEVTDAHNVTIVAVTKKVIADWKKNQGAGKEQVVNELIQIQPSLIDMRARLLEMELDQLQEALEQMKGNQ
jgi:hypothetical protein